MSYESKDGPEDYGPCFVSGRSHGPKGQTEMESGHAPGKIWNEPRRDGPTSQITPNQFFT